MPGGAIELRTEDYRLIRYPDVVLDPTFRAAQVTWSRTTRPLGEVIDEIAVHARDWGVPGVAWWISAATEPAGTEEALRARDAQLIDAVQILARELGGGLPPLDVPGDVMVELVQDERTFRASSAITVQGWGRPEPDEAELARQLDETLANLDGASKDLKELTARFGNSQALLPRLLEDQAYGREVTERLREAVEHLDTATDRLV